MNGKALLGGAAAVAALGAVLFGIAHVSRKRKETKVSVSFASPLAPALAALIAEVNFSWPARSRASDGGVPSAAHHEHNPNSDHERGDAYDFTVDKTNGPDPDALADLARNDDRVSYVIYNERIANKDKDGNVWRPYVKTAIQTDPHTSHVHVSVKHAARNDVRQWGVAKIKGAAPPAKVAAVSAPMQPVPAGYVNMKQSRVTPARASWAQTLLHDQSFSMGQVRTSDIDGPVAARVEVHPADAHIDNSHRGISLYEPPVAIA